jgi:hypothetical protein
MAVRRDIADLVLEAFDIAVSRKLALQQTRDLALDVIMAERPDLARGDARVLLARVWQRLAGRGLFAAGAAE